MLAQTIVICEYCDVVHERVPLRAGSLARCRRCGAVLYRARRFELDALLALTVATAVMFLIANCYPIASLQLSGQVNDATLWAAVLAAWDTGVGPVAAVAALTVFTFPLLQIVLYGYVLLPMRLGRVPQHFRPAMRALHALAPWSMVEVFMLGVLVAAVKLQGLAELTVRPGLLGFAALTILLTALTSSDPRRLWDRYSELSP
jgi:paraquat-inducible protein A